jgi:hypothetical protein
MAVIAPSVATLFLMPFLGTDRITLAALKTGQRCLGIELGAKYVGAASHDSLHLLISLYCRSHPSWV